MPSSASSNDIEPVLGLTWILELPFHLGVPDGAIILAFEPETTVDWDGWGPADFEELLGTDELPSPMTTPRLRLEFQTRTRPATTYAAAADKWFPWLADPNAPKTGRGKPRRPPGHRPKPVRETVSIVAGTRFIGPDEAEQHDPENETATDALMDDARDEMLTCLSSFCVAFAAVTGSLIVRPIELGDLSPAMPGYTQLYGPHPLNSYSFVTTAHERWSYSNRVELEGPRADAVEALFHSSPQAGGDNLLFDAYELFVQADQDLAVGRYTSAVRQASTGVEVLAMTLLREIGGRQADDEKVNGWLGSGFMNVLADHLPRLLGVSINRHASTDPVGAWVNGAYVTRNNTVHRGQRPTRQQATDALAQTSDLRNHLRDAIAERADLQDLAAWFLYPSGDPRVGSFPTSTD